MGRSADLVRGIYDAFGKGDVPAVLGAMDPGIEWNEAENFIYADGNPYVGPQAVARGCFAVSPPISRDSTSFRSASSRATAR